MRAYRWIGFCVFAASLTFLASVGCNRDAGTKDKEVTKPNLAIESKKDNAGKKIEAKLTSRSNSIAFKDAVILEPAPEGQERPPDKTVNGRNVGQIFETIANDLWQKVSFTTEDGRNIKYSAVVATELGDMHVDLFGDSAPNHVRNFVCLAKTGYFDGMTFYFSINAKVGGETTAAYVETGCPKGTGEFGCGSIGYWLKPEVSPKLHHEEGVLGACLNGDPNTAACRFYIAAARMPQMDGYFTIFGKVTKGLDIVRTINTRAVYQDEQDPSMRNRLQQPVLIRNVTIQTAVE